MTTQLNGENNKELRIRAEMFHCFLLQKYAYSGQTLGQIKKDFYDLAHVSIAAFLRGDAVQVCLLHGDLFSVTPNPIPDLATIIPEQYRPLQFMDMLAEKDCDSLSLELKAASIGTFDFTAFAAKVGHSLGAVYYGALQVANEWVPNTFDNPIESNAVKVFAASEEGVKRANWLVNDLRANGPLNLTAIGNLHFLPDNVKATRWIKHISETMDIDYDFAGGGNDVCWAKSIGRQGAVRNTVTSPQKLKPITVTKRNPLPRLNPGMPMDTVGTPATIPFKDHISLEDKQHFWGVVDNTAYEDAFGNPMMLVKMVQLEHKTELAGFHWRTRRVSDVSNGEFVVGTKSFDNNPCVFPLSNRVIMFREWHEFGEAHSSYKTLEDFVRGGGGFLTPKFRTFAREIFIIDAGRVYAGLEIEFTHRTIKLKSTLLRSRNTLANIYDLGRDFFFLNGFKKVIYLQDEFRLAFPHNANYRDTDALLADRNFWEEFKVPVQATLDPVQAALLNTIIENGGRIIGPQLGSALKKKIPQFTYPYNGFEKLRDLALAIPNVKADPLRDEYFIDNSGPLTIQQPDLSNGRGDGNTLPSQEFSTPSTPINDPVRPPEDNHLANTTPNNVTNNVISITDEKELRRLIDGIETNVEWGHTDECTFLNNLLKVVRNKCHYSYTSRDIIRFHCAIKNGMLTILGGDPGTGKSSLIEIYSRALFGGRYSTGPATTSTFLQVSVNPAWAEPADLLGFEGASGKFREARNGLCQFLRQAMEVKDDELRICCFEEINLACVEHYFSDFMQLLSRTHNRIIAGYDRAGFSPQPQEEIKAQDQSKQVIASPLELGDNVRFVGTCNFDETVKPMSRRFYDRCHYIELESPRNREFSEEDPLIAPECFADLFTSPISWASFSSWRNSGLPIAAPVARLFSLLTEKLRAIDLMPSYRCVNDIKQYITMRPPNPDDEQELKLGMLQLHALDEAVAQKILSKFRPDPFKSKEQQELHAFLLDAGLEISAQFMEILNKRYEVPQF